MLKNYFLTALNVLLKNKLYSLINIVGLSIGLAASLLIILYVQNQSSYDDHWTNSDRIYRLNTTMDLTGSNSQRSGNTSLLTLGAFKNYFADEIEYGSRVRTTKLDVFVGDTRFEQAIPFVDPDMIKMFDFEVLSGDLSASLSSAEHIALSRELANKLFGTEDAVGKTLSIMDPKDDALRDYRVTAVYRLPPNNTVLSLPAMMLLDESKLDFFTFSNWLTLDFQTFLQLKPRIQPQQLHSRQQPFINQYVDISRLNAGPDVEASDRVDFDLQSIGDIYLDNSVADNVSGGNKTVVMAFSAIAALVLLIGCINFTILSAAKATQRAKEVAMRKMVGAGRNQLMMQYLGETFLVVLPAIFLAIALVELLLPLFETMVGVSLHVSYASISTYAYLVSLSIIVSVLGGFYPALVMSYFSPAKSLKASGANEGKKVFGLRNALVVFQFSISIALLIATAVIYAQVLHSANRDPGFNSENLLVIENLNRRADVTELKNTLKQQISALPTVSATTLVAYKPMQTSGYATLGSEFSMAGDDTRRVRLSTMSVDYDFLNTMQISLLVGRDFNEQQDQPSAIYQGSYRESISESSLIINFSAARSLGFSAPEQALGTRLSTRGFNPASHNFTVVGVVADNQYYSLRSAPRAEVYILSPRYMTDILNVRYRGNSQMALTELFAVWKQVMGDAVLSTSFVDQNMGQQFKQEQLEAKMLLAFSLLAIAIACLGLYGSSALSVDRRTKEIGIRKVMGAQVQEIVSLLLWQFSKPVLLANVIAWPVATWAMLTWLQRFPYQIDGLLLIPICVFAGGIALSIAWLTVASNTVRVAIRKPVLALRYE